MLLGVIVVAVGIAVSIMSLFMLAMDEVVGIRVPCVPSLLPPSEIQNLDSTKIVSTSGKIISSK